MKTYKRGYRKPYNQWQQSVTPAPETTVQKFVNWSVEQLLIFAWFATGLIDGTAWKNLVIIARAGTGKTSTLIEGFKHIPAKYGRILYGVFNKKNQLEAQGKIKDPRVTVLTWHALGFSFIKLHWGKVKPDNWVERDRVKQACPEFPEQVLHVATQLVSKLKNKFLVPTLDNAKETMARDDLELYGEHKAWNDRLPQIALDAIKLSHTRDAQGRISFDDMVYLPVALNMVSPIYDFAVGDEGQDLNPPQLEMLVRVCNGPIALVGDDRQQIYSFRGAMHGCLEHFRERLQAGVLGLKTTFRCPKSVVARAKQYVPDYEAYEGNAEGLVEALGHDKAIESCKIGDAILSRINAPLMRICLKFIRKGVRAEIEGRDIGKALLKIVNDLEPVFDATLGTDIHDFLSKLDAWRDFSTSKATGKYAQNKIDVITDQHETLRALGEASKSVDEVKTRLQTLFQDTGSEYAAPAKQKITLSSVHKAKGLEWPNVFVLSDTFMSSRAKTPEQVQEEQNIYYVALTRSQERLVITDSGKS